MTTTVIYGQAGQVARHVTPEHVAVATYEITDMNQEIGAAGRVIASGAAVSPTWDLEIDASAGPSEADATIIPVASTIGPTIGESAILIAPDGLSEPVKISAISPGAYLRAGSFLAAPFVPTSRVQSLTITAPIPVELYNFEDALLDQRPLRIEWTYTIASGPRVVTEIVELVRASDAAFSTGPAIETLAQGYPELNGRLLEGLTIEALAAYSYQGLVAELERREIDHTSLMLGHVGRMLLVSKMLLEAAIRGYAPGMTERDKFMEFARADYGAQLEALAIGTPGGQAQLVSASGVVEENPSKIYRGPVWAA